MVDFFKKVCYNICVKKKNKIFIKKGETKMTKFEIATRHEHALKEVKNLKDKIEMLREEMARIDKDCSINDLENPNASYVLNFMLDDISSSLYHSLESCELTINELKNKLIDKAWHDFYAQEYEGEGEEND